LPFKTKIPLRAGLTREANTIRLRRDAVNALYKLVFIIIVMEMLELPQMLKPLARNMTFSLKKQALSLPDVKVTKKYEKRD
jgi:hypothetical protein